MEWLLYSEQKLHERGLDEASVLSRYALSGTVQTISEFEQQINDEEDPSFLGNKHLRRPGLPWWIVNGENDKDLLFQHVDIYPQYRNGQPEFLMFGVTKQHNSICVHVSDFYPYFYILADNLMAEFESLDTVQRVLNDIVHQELDFGHPQLKESIRRDLQLRDDDDYEEAALVRLVEADFAYDLLYYNQNKCHFWKVTVAHAKLIPCLSASLRQRGLGGYYTDPVHSYECDMLFEVRFMVDMKMGGCSWVTLPKHQYSWAAKRGDRDSTCQMEAFISYHDLVVHPLTGGEFSAIAPLRILSFDIECAGRKGVFPEPEHDPVIAICATLMVVGHPELTRRQVYSLRETSAINGAALQWTNDEKQLLNDFAKGVRVADPDLITGWNTHNFDIPFLLDRAKHIGAKDLPHLSRLWKVNTQARDSQFSNKAHGTHKTKTINLPGRVLFDMMLFVQRSYKLTSYTLNAVCARFLKEQKEDVHYSEIRTLFEGDADTRRRLAIYCLKDTYLPIQLMIKLCAIPNYVEMARITRMPLLFLLTKGQQIRVQAQLYFYCRQEGYRVPYSPQQSKSADVNYEGATVIDPKRGYYNVPIATLDFSSLYPSIMMAHNLCYSTYIHDPASLARFPADQVTRTPNGDYFVKSGVRSGLLPRILSDLLAARKQAKLEMAAATDPFMIEVLDGRQLALKVCANSVYGFTGAMNGGKLPLLAISASVTSFGREMIEASKQMVEEEHEGAVVVYGDTDSIMVNFGVKTVAEAMRLGKYFAKRITEQKFLQPIRLLFEKVYYPYLLINKKRYAALYWTDPEKWSHLDAKGLESVRRDNCMLLRLIMNRIMHSLFVDQKPLQAVEFVSNAISDLRAGNIDMSLLVITKQLSKTDYKSAQVHLEVVNKMLKRDPGSAPQAGDRVPYVMTRGVKGVKSSNLGEHPMYALEHNIQPDTEWYLKNQLYKPLSRLLDPVLEYLHAQYAQRQGVKPARRADIRNFYAVKPPAVKLDTVATSAKASTPVKPTAQERKMLEAASATETRVYDPSLPKSVAELFKSSNTFGKITTPTPAPAPAATPTSTVATAPNRNPTTKRPLSSSRPTVRGVKRKVGSEGLLTRFTVALPRCMDCNGSISTATTTAAATDTRRAYCDSCLKRHVSESGAWTELHQQSFLHAMGRYRHFHQLQQRIEANCHQCQKSSFQDVVCSNDSCPVFYSRIRLKQELEQARDVLNRLVVDRDSNATSVTTTTTGSVAKTATTMTPMDLSF